MQAQIVLHNPKLRSERQSYSTWYGYYAGYSTPFVEDVLAQLDLARGARVMDPWNGSGTTTCLAQDRGLLAIGFDINPAMVIVAKARSLDPRKSEKLPNLCSNLLQRALDAQDRDSAIACEPLETWLVPESAAAFRRIERAIQDVLMSGPPYRQLFKEPTLGAVSSLAAFFYTALFRTLNESLHVFRASNPTWIKQPPTLEQRLAMSSARIHRSFRIHVAEMTKALWGRVRTGLFLQELEPEIDVASSEAIPLDDASIRAVISSPPYCTRIDYVIATRPELALLACAGRYEVQALRGQMIGTPTISKTKPTLKAGWGSTCSGFLDAVANHASKASGSYYLKNYLQYFNSMYLSLSEIDRTLMRDGDCILVAQDSYYKDVHLDLPQIFSEMSHSLRWSLRHRSSFVSRTMAGINSRARKYDRPWKATESVLFFRKAS